MIINVYELMGLIKDNKAPKKIKCDDVIFMFVDENYYSELRDIYLFNFINDHYNDFEIPNVTVEILPEKNCNWEDIEEIKLIDNDIEFYDDEKVRHFITTNRKDRDIYIAKINQLIKNQKYLKERLESKDENN